MYYQFLAPATLSAHEDWTGLRTIGVAIRECTERGQTTCEVRYDLSSLKKHARPFAAIVRKHWRIENPPQADIGASTSRSAKMMPCAREPVTPPRTSHVYAASH